VRAAVISIFSVVLWATPVVGQGLVSDQVPLLTGTPQWSERPAQLPWTPHRTDLPTSALVVLDCLISEDGRLACQIVNEDPPGWGFGEAALRLSSQLRMAPTTREGDPTANHRYRLRVPFETE
jgi:protein TonB